MNLIKTAVFGALGCLAWRAWQQRKAAADASTPGSSLPAGTHTDAPLPTVSQRERPAVVPGSQSSRGYGAP
jgi:hypothetical protein